MKLSVGLLTALFVLAGCQTTHLPGTFESAAQGYNVSSVKSAGSFGHRPSPVDVNHVPQVQLPNIVHDPRFHPPKELHPRDFSEGSRSVLENYDAYRYHAYIGTNIDNGGDGSETDYFAAYEVHSDLSLPAAAASGYSTVLYAPTMIGADSCPVEIVSAYQRDWGQSNTQRYIGIWDHTQGHFVWSTWSDVAGFLGTYTTIDGGRPMCEVEIHSSGNVHYAWIWNYQTSSWNQMGSGISGTRTVFGTGGWCIFEQYFPYNVFSYSGSNTNIQADYIQQDVGHAGWLNISDLHSNGGWGYNENTAGFSFSYPSDWWHWSCN